MKDLPSIAKLTNSFSKLPGVGVKSAERMAYAILSMNPEDVEEGKDFLSNLNPNSLETLKAYVEPALAQIKVGDHVQFERQGYFCLDKDSTSDHLVYNRTVALKDSWAKMNS